MAERSIFWDTSGVGDGATQYTESDLFNWLRRLVGDGVLEGVDSELAVTGTASPVQVAAGSAFVYGSPYWNDASLNVVIPTPVLGTTGHRIVLRKNWTAQTVRITLLSSSDGVGTIPAATQSAGTTWDISLATLTITTGGVITVTDVRPFALINARINTDNINTSQVTTAKIADANVTTVKIADNNVTTAKIADSNVTTAKIADSNVTTAKLATNAVTTAKIADAQVTAAKLVDGDGSGVDADLVKGVNIETLRRQGGNGTNWNTPGTNNYVPSATRIQAGVIEATPGTSSGLITVTFPVAFTGTPIVTANSTINSVGGLAQGITVEIATLSTTQVQLQWNQVDGTTVSRIAIGWHAIGGG